MTNELQKEMLRYSELNGYPISEFSEAACNCGNRDFHLFSDDEEGGAFLVCPDCGKEHDLEASKNYIAQAQQNICSCEHEKLSIGIGKAFYESSTDIRWVYIGARCPKCALSGVYVDWKTP